MSASPSDFLRTFVRLLDERNIRYRIVGSLASMMYSEVRFTNDIDILAELREHDVEAILAVFPSPEYYVSAIAARDAIRKQHQFNILHFASGYKIDVIQKKTTPFGERDISDGRRLDCNKEFTAWFATPENVILAKLMYFREGRSEKHLRDIASMLLVQGDLIDREYIQTWAASLGVTEEWRLVASKCDN